MGFNLDSNTVSAINTNTLTRELEVLVGKSPRILAQHQNQKIWVVNQDSFNISILDPDTGIIDRSIALPYASIPYGIVFSLDGNAAYVSLEATGSILKIDACLL